MKNNLYVKQSKQMFQLSLMAMVTVLACGTGIVRGEPTESSTSLPENTRIEEGSLFKPTNLTVRLADNFGSDHDVFDMTRWVIWKGKAKTEGGQCLLETLTPRTFGMAGFGTRKKQFNPGLVGTNGVEISLVDYVMTGKSPEFDAATAERLGIRHRIEVMGPHFITGLSLTISQHHGQIGFEENMRTVQLHFDMITNWGLEWWLARSIVPADYKKYPRWDLKLPTFKKVLQQGVFISEPCLGLAVHHYDPLDIPESPFGHRIGLYLTDDGNTLFWTIDGKVQDKVDITGFFASRADLVKDGAHLTVSGIGAGKWIVDDVAIYASPLE